MFRFVQGRHGAFFANDKDIYVGTSLLRYGEFSECEVDVFRTILGPGSVVVDGGANVGALTVPLRRIVGADGLVIAYEPQRWPYYNLCTNLLLNSLLDVRAHRAALGAEPGTAPIADLPAHVLSNFGAVSSGLTDNPHEPVPVVALDCLGLERLDLLKLDVEGHELEALRGASSTVERCKPVVYAESDRAELRAPLVEWLRSRGYRIWEHKPPLYRNDNFLRCPVDCTGNVISRNLLCFPPTWTGPVPTEPEV